MLHYGDTFGLSPYGLDHIFHEAFVHTCQQSPVGFSCSTKTLSFPLALLFFSAATPFLYSSSLKGYTTHAFPYVARGSRGRFSLNGMLPLLLTM